MCGIKIPPQDFALKMQVGLMCEGRGDLCTRGDVFAGHYGMWRKLSTTAC